MLYRTPRERPRRKKRLHRDMLKDKFTAKRGFPMHTAKQDVREMLDHLPDDSAIEDVQYHFYVLEKIRRGRDDIRDGRHLTHEQAKERLSKWLKP
jgi:predicted transcriptional regulator